ncbi:MAG TPA: ChbG/HpnK family deacetylase [Deltaproteobacteria bacterium]|nr:ChbG/HpnK family deacetylase [Deltaproteobacteria bacterium]HQI00470.1 ChbG/HpnK family deacetylase [Deltaproteobacteria bacterium]HQJ07369.1 ChbG/HpnK family deacetylase [Deltaproteobacteria bacterium]
MIHSVIVNADDLGLSREINKGISKGMEKGVVSDASLMIEAPCSGDALEGLKTLGVGHIGIHVNIDEQIGWDIHGKERFSRNDLMSMLASEDFLAVCRERVRAQIEKVMSSGLSPTHIDSHHHVHGFPPIFSMILDLAIEYGIPAMRFSADGYTLTTREPIPFHASVYRTMREALEREQIFFCKSMMEGARKIPDISSFPAELVVHPSSGGDPWREGELETLLSDAFHEAVHDRDVHLVSYKDLIGRRSDP